MNVRGMEYLPRRQKVCAQISPNWGRLTHMSVKVMLFVKCATDFIVSHGGKGDVNQH